MDESQRREYWKTNIQLVLILLSVWALVSFVFGILLVEPLNTVVINSFPLGFWFAQQGSIFTFVTLIGIYVWRMDRLDEQYGVSERTGRKRPPTHTSSPSKATPSHVEEEAGP